MAAAVGDATWGRAERGSLDDPLSVGQKSGDPLRRAAARGPPSRRSSAALYRKRRERPVFLRPDREDLLRACAERERGRRTVRPGILAQRARFASGGRRVG